MARNQPPPKKGGSGSPGVTKERYLGRVVGGFLGIWVRHQTALDEGDQAARLFELCSQATTLFPGPDPFEGALQGGKQAIVEYAQRRPWAYTISRAAVNWGLRPDHVVQQSEFATGMMDTLDLRNVFQMIDASIAKQKKKGK